MWTIQIVVPLKYPGWKSRREVVSSLLREKLYYYICVIEVLSVGHVHIRIVNVQTAERGNSPTLCIPTPKKPNLT